MAFTIDLAGRTALVTGASKGLGEAIARGLAEAGANVVLAARSKPAIDRLAKEIEAAGGAALAVETDVTDEASVDAMVEAALARFGQVDALVNNAGVGLTKALVDMTLADWNRVIETNLTGVFLCTRAASRPMLARGYGRIVNIASIDGTVGVSEVSAYCASKAGVLNLTKALALEWARKGICVNAIAPGYFRTEMTEGALDDPVVGPLMLKRIPLRRVGRPEEIVPLAVYLASPLAEFVTGSAFVIDGGETSR